jgi:SAM-dependent methyltransferase
MHSRDEQVEILEKDYLWLHLRALPYFRSLMRSVEARFYRDIELPAPTLDIGCGDGHFASVAFRRPLEVGIDPWAVPIREAVHWQSYQALVQGDAGRLPFPDQYFSSAVSNSVLEHIPELDAVLVETARVLRPSAPFIFCVPNHQFLSSLSIGRVLDKAGLHALADHYRAFFNRISRHYHSDSPYAWLERMDKSGFTVDNYWNYYPPKAMQISEWGHFFGAPALVTRKLSGRWILFPYRWNPFLRMIEHSLRPYYEDDPIAENGVCTFYKTRRKG